MTIAATRWVMTAPGTPMLRKAFGAVHHRRTAKRVGLVPGAAGS
jgi:hypothetical protein